MAEAKRNHHHLGACLSFLSPFLAAWPVASCIQRRKGSVIVFSYTCIYFMTQMHA